MQILEGIRIVDWTVMHAGPMATLMLGELGAEVIKIEDTMRGDLSRGTRKLAGLEIPVIEGRSVYFEGLNRNKKGITLDLNQDEGREILYRLVEKSDVFIHNRPESQVVSRKLDYENLSRYNSKLVYMSLPGFGRKGPLKDDLSFDISGQALSGLMYEIGEPGCQPGYVHGGPIDQTSGTLAAYGIITGLLARERFGIGQEIDSSSLTAAIWLQTINFQLQLFAGDRLRPITREDMDNPLLNWYECKEGKWIFLTALASDLFWEQFCQAIERPELADDQKFNSHLKRSENARDLIQVFMKVFKTKTQEEWLDILKKYKVMHAAILTMDEAVNHPQVLANEDIIEYDHPAWGKVRLVNTPIRYSKTPAQVQGPAPMWGQHTEEVLLETLGMTWDDISKLKEKKVVT